MKYSQMLTELVYSPDILHGEKSTGDSLTWNPRYPHHSLKASARLAHVQAHIAPVYP